MMSSEVIRSLAREAASKARKARKEARGNMIFYCHRCGFRLISRRHLYCSFLCRQLAAKGL
jgi:hypothetical protein